ncbi:ribosomal-protein-alanine N-acetyltransferase [bacterium]|nr:ribosomal-protein-alanine N-acetyltransferase [bacterium]
MSDLDGEPSVCAMTAEDLPAVLEIERLSFDDPWSERMFLDTLEAPVGQCRVLEVRGRIIGFLIGWSVAGEGHLLNVAVRPDERGKGFGRFLVNHWLMEGLEEGWTVAFLEVRPGNREAIGLYEDLGFITAGRRKSYYPNGEDALLMVWSPDSLRSGRQA